jgi:predicted Rossmann fold nucleotide-binding protein DprA/Smf involved in DNA uptake
MRIAIVGSREYPDLEQVREYVRGLPPSAVVTSGGAIGVDTTAIDESDRRGLQIVVFLPVYEKYARRAPLVRNQLIVDFCDRLVAFHAADSRGTAHVVSLAKKAGKTVEVFGPEGAQR